MVDARSRGTAFVRGESGTVVPLLKQNEEGGFTTTTNAPVAHQHVSRVPLIPCVLCPLQTHLSMACAIDITVAHQRPATNQKPIRSVQ